MRGKVCRVEVGRFSAVALVSPLTVMTEPCILKQRNILLTEGKFTLG